MSVPYGINSFDLDLSGVFFSPTNQPENKIAA